MEVDIYTSVGYALELLANSEYHKQFNVFDYFEVEILPALEVNQVRFYLANDGIPTAMITWALLDEKTQHDIHKTGRALEEHEWKCGDRVFVNDWISPYGNMRDVMHDISHNVFPDEVVTSIRRNQDGSVRRVNRWTGISLRREREALAI